MKQLETERLILRPFLHTDLATMYRLIYADPQVAIPFSGHTWTIAEMRDKFMQRTQVAADEFGWLAIVRKEDEQMLGLVALQRHLPDDDMSYMLFADRPNTVGQNPDFIEAELTYALGRPFWGQGYATEACRAMLVYGFEEMGIGRFVNSVVSNNHGSIKLMQRLGFHIEQNIHPNPFQHTDAPGIIGILTRLESSR